MLIFYRFEPDDAYKTNAYKKKRVWVGDRGFGITGRGLERAE